MPVVIQEKTRPILKKPALYQVIIFDDAITTYECVMALLIQFFKKTEGEAYEIAFQVDITGSALAGIYTKDIAETKISLANLELSTLQFPLRIEALPCN
jgi:ATP-dependent Clp protease adaptor protein ClpS